MLDVVQVEEYPLRIGDAGSAADLPKTRHSWRDQEPATLGGGIMNGLGGNGRSRTNKGHLASKDVEKLGEFVDAGAAEKASQAGNSGVVGYFEDGAFGLVELLDETPLVVSVGVHRAEFQHTEGLSVYAETPLGKKDWA